MSKYEGQTDSRMAELFRMQRRKLDEIISELLSRGFNFRNTATGREMTIVTTDSIELSKFIEIPVTVLEKRKVSF